MGLAVGFAAIAIPQRSLQMGAVIGLGVTAAMTFLVLDLFAPEVGMSARNGAGFGIGANMVGFPQIAVAGGAIPGGPAAVVEGFGSGAMNTGDIMYY